MEVWKRHALQGVEYRHLKNVSCAEGLLRSNETRRTMKRSVTASGVARALSLLVVAACIWIPSLHLVFRRNIHQYRTVEGLSPTARSLAATYLDVWADPSLRERELAAMRGIWSGPASAEPVWRVRSPGWGAGCRVPGGASAWAQAVHLRPVGHGAVRIPSAARRGRVHRVLRPAGDVCARAIDRRLPGEGHGDAAWAAEDQRRR